MSVRRTAIDVSASIVIPASWFCLMMARSRVIVTRPLELVSRVTCRDCVLTVVSTAVDFASAPYVDLVPDIGICTSPTQGEELQDWTSTPSKKMSIFDMPEVEVATAVRVSVSPARTVAFDTDN